MKQNVGSIDRVIRLIAGIAVIAFFYPSWWAAIGGVLLFTAVVGWCPPYQLLGLSTCAVKTATDK